MPSRSHRVILLSHFFPWNQFRFTETRHNKGACHSRGRAASRDHLIRTIWQEDRGVCVCAGGGFCSPEQYMQGPMRGEKGSKRAAPYCNNSSVHMAHAKQCMTQQASEWDLAPFLRVTRGVLLPVWMGPQRLVWLGNFQVLCNQNFRKSNVFGQTWGQVQEVI